MEQLEEIHKTSEENPKKINFTKDFPFTIHANKKFRGSHAGHYIPSSNLVEIKEEIDEDNPSY